MIKIARKNCPEVEFKVGSISKLPYLSSSFDVVTASLSIHYINDLNPVFKEVFRVLKKGGIFYYSISSPIASEREWHEDENFKIFAIGEIYDKKTRKKMSLGNGWDESVSEWELIPGMLTKKYIKTFRTYLKNIRTAKLELIDFIDCKPTPSFKKYDSVAYERFSKFPLFSIYVCQKK